MIKNILMLIIFILIVFSCQNDIYNKKYLVWTTTDLFKENSFFSDKIVKVYCSTIVTVLEIDDDNVWYYVKDDRGNEGWLRHTKLEEYSDELYKELLVKLEREISQEESVPDKSLEEIQKDALNHYIYNAHEVLIYTSIDEIKNGLGEPEEEIITEVQNKTDITIIDNKIEFIYPGLSLTVYYTTMTKMMFDESMRITSSDYELYEGVNVGKSKEYLFEKFGEPHEIKGNVLKYIRTWGAPSYVEFIMSDDIIVEIHWEFYSG